MRLKLYTDYALRVLIYLGARGDTGELATITEIAERYSISRNHVMKVVYQLGQLGYIETLRGKGGGLRMRMKAEDINVGILVRQTEADMAIVECFSSTGRCRLAPDCRLQGVLREALDAFMGVLDRYTLADILENRQSVRQLLGLAG